jgi:cytidyltransferase-like protein
MIVEFVELPQYRDRVAMVDGAFDPLHHGHIEYFREAARLGLPLLCNVASDDYVRRKHVPLLAAEQRAQVLDAVRYIDYVHLNRHDTETVLRELRPRYYVKGADWRGRLPRAQLELCAQHDIEIVFLQTVRESSSRLLAAYREEPPADVAAFEALVLGQQPVPAQHYDSEYFTSEWRQHGNRYTLEARREIEGRHPELIKEVFAPKRVLDLGCGPGALMCLLHELGVHADGIDVSESSRRLAPPEVRDRITVGSLTDVTVAPGSYDLVLCREVFEHLTVLDVRRAVANMHRITSRFAYVTTRFHPDPASLLDVTTQFDVDPTHITLLNKDFLRVLFVLEGFRQRPDLEARMDWMGKGRVLVYEKA